MHRGATTHRSSVCERPLRSSQCRIAVQSTQTYKAAGWRACLEAGHASCYCANVGSMLGRDNHHSDISQQQRRLWVRLAARYDTPV